MPISPINSSPSSAISRLERLKGIEIGHALHFAKSASQGQRDEDFDAVGPGRRSADSLTNTNRGLDNAGKTTIVKKVMGEDVSTVSPTLGFIIKTIDYEG